LRERLQMRGYIQIGVVIIAAATALSGCQGLPLRLPTETGSPADPPAPSASQAGVCRPRQKPPQCIHSFSQRTGQRQVASG
jgi:hypothetical protein